MLDRVTGMRVFIEAATQASLSAAGRMLGMSPAMATKHVDALEVRLGIKLLHRTTRRLTLTDAGADYLAACRRILQELDEAESALAARRTEAVGRLRTCRCPLARASSRPCCRSSVAAIRRCRWSWD